MDAEGGALSAYCAFRFAARMTLLHF
ncbi:MAG: hypothetical protein RJA24_614, partial [Pseudomonadota bacterium]